MLEGRFGATSGAPYIEAAVAFPRFNLSGQASLLIDTGADVTTLSPEFVGRLGLDYSRFTDVQEAQGIGGREDLFVEEVVLYFLDKDDNCLLGYRVQARVLPLTPQYIRYPCLLGRDVVNRWRFECDFSQSLVLAEVRSADQTIAL